MRFLLIKPKYGRTSIFRFLLIRMDLMLKDKLYVLVSNAVFLSLCLQFRGSL